MPRLLLLALEFAAIFVAVPLLVYSRLIPNAPIPYLVVAGACAFAFLRHDPTFDQSRLSSGRHVARLLLPLLLRDAVFLSFLGVAVWRFAPHLLFSLVRRAPLLWAAIVLLYPLLSVYPQELLYRAFFFHRYQPLFGSGWRVLFASACAFGFAHVILGNWISVALCLIGGLLFALTYQQSGSLLLTCLDHALFGNFIFTVGLGQFFYHGSRH
jgi:uncharacterized protein